MTRLYITEITNRTGRLIVVLPSIDARGSMGAYNRSNNLRDLLQKQLGYMPAATVREYDPHYHNTLLACKSLRVRAACARYLPAGRKF